jgi:hypothetical protein
VRAIARHWGDFARLLGFRGMEIRAAQQQPAHARKFEFDTGKVPEGSLEQTTSPPSGRCAPAATGPSQRATRILVDRQPVDPWHVAVHPQLGHHVCSGCLPLPSLLPLRWDAKGAILSDVR